MSDQEIREQIRRGLRDDELVRLVDAWNTKEEAARREAHQRELGLREEIARLQNSRWRSFGRGLANLLGILILGASAVGVAPFAVQSCESSNYYSLEKAKIKAEETRRREEEQRKIAEKERETKERLRREQEDSFSKCASAVGHDTCRLVERRVLMGCLEAGQNAQDTNHQNAIIASCVVRKVSVSGFFQGF